MKRLLYIIIGILFITGCGIIKYKIYKHSVSFDESVDFRHIHYQASTSFDYGSDENYRSYTLYDKIPNPVYSVIVNRVMGSMDTDIQKMEKEKKVSKKKKKINGIQWNVITYTEEKKDYHYYYAAYDKNEYYCIEFYHANLCKEFEKQFMKNVTIDKKH